MDEPVTLADMHREGVFLWVQCKGCGKMAYLSPRTLAGTPGGPRPDIATEAMHSTTVAAAIAKLKCSRCGEKDVDTRVVREWG